MVTLHYIPSPEREGGELLDMQTAKCGARLPRHRQDIPAHPERDAHYWATSLRSLGDEHHDEHRRHGIFKKRCPRCVPHYHEDCAVNQTGDTPYAVGEPLENMRMIDTTYGTGPVAWLGGSRGRNPRSALTETGN